MKHYSKYLSTICMASLLIILAAFAPPSHRMYQVACFKGQQVTGVTISNQNRLFANFPRWRDNVAHSVVEINNEGAAQPYPNSTWNSWELGQPISDSIFVAVQSVVAFENTLYVLDTRNPLFKGVRGAPRIFAFDLNTNQLKRVFKLSTSSFHSDSYINDLRIDKHRQKMYLTDSGHGGLVIMDLESGKSTRVLDDHYSTRSETNVLTFKNGEWNNTVHSDGIALDSVNHVLYYHALTGYNLYAIPTEALNGTASDVEAAVNLVAKTPAPDGMIINGSEHLFLADLEHNKIMQMKLPNGPLTVFAEGADLKWVDTFSILGNDLYFTTSRINEAQGDISGLSFCIYKKAMH